VEKYVTATQATDDNIIFGMRFTCWISNDTNTHSEHIILIVIYSFLGNSPASEF